MRCVFMLLAFFMAFTDTAAYADDGILVWKLQANDGVADADVNLISNFIANQVAASSGRRVISESDIKTILKGEETRQRCGAEDTSCVVEVSNAMGVPEAISGDLGKIGSYWMLNLRRINVRNAEVISRSSRSIEGSIDQMIKALPGAVAELFGKKAGRALTVEKQPENGVLLVSSTPDGARVRVDDRYMGRTPVNRSLKPGTYRVRSELEGYGVDEREVRILSDKKTEVSISLIRLEPGQLEVSSEPSGAALLLDGEVKGQTPYKEKVDAGEYTLKLKLDGYHTAKQKVQINPGETTGLSLNLETDYPMNPYKKWGYVSFFTGLGLAVFGGFSTYASKVEADSYKAGDWGALDRSLAWEIGMGLGFGLGGAAMITGIVLWALSPGDEAWWAEHPVSAGPSADGQGAVVTLGGRW